MPGIRGGNWNNDSSNLRVSDRNNAGNTNADRNNNYGVRPCRTSSVKHRSVVMKKLDSIYNQVAAKENLYRAAYFAARSRRYRPAAADFNFRLEEELGSLHGELLDKTYRHGDYRLFTIYEPKKRLIAAAPFRDRVVHHAVHDVIEPIIDHSFIYDSYACRRNKGVHRALDRAQGFLRQNRFCLHADIRKYFLSIDHGVLKTIIRRKIGDEDVLWLLDEIIDSAVSLRGGLPIGNLTSQFFANLYLNELDYFVKQKLKVRYYIRYMDDFLVFSESKFSLRGIKDALREFLRSCLRLRLHEEKSQIYETSNGLRFLGFRLHHNFRRLTTENVRSFRTRLKLQKVLLSRGIMSGARLKDSVRCWVSHSNYADTNRLRFNIFSELTKRDERFGSLLKGVLLPQDEVRKAGKGRGGGVMTDLWDRAVQLWWLNRGQWTELNPDPCTLIPEEEVL